MWTMHSRTLAASQMIYEKSRSVASRAEEYFTLFRKAHDHYAKKMIIPYLVLAGPVEIDESKVNHRKFHCLGNNITIRWMFGMYCRQTKIMIIYIMRDKSIPVCVPIMKRHIM